MEYSICCNDILRYYIKWLGMEYSISCSDILRVALLIIQRNLRKFLQLRNWLWWKLYSKVKPLLSIARVEDELRALEEKLKAANEALEKEEKLRKELETQNVKVLQEKNDLFMQLEAERSSSGDVEERLTKALTQKGDLESQVQVRL
ncbi:myosin heavy chain, striated muscle-like, partial [Limulus polyphemus]|uniref:Myosin heavy chain, striated muscle-like n=1 Tax=Limulus polyphemus TaxID=6850 RepID=A0ABM1RX17_LIMPO